MRYETELQVLLHECNDPVDHERAELLSRAIRELADLIAATDNPKQTLDLVSLALRDRVRDLRRI